ncbi:MAG: ABC transporter permease [Marinisporobacter sp.]|jgi:putative ABC transport system permease protein|nr:ABC transporter permease [Marinisporobacter sp.]
MNILESIKMAIISVRGNKLRTLLTMLGIIIGISSVITLVALGKGSQNSMTKEFKDGGANKAVIYLNEDEVTSEEMNMDHSDLKAIKRIYGSKLEAISFSQGLAGSLTLGRKTYHINLSGVASDYNKIENMTIKKGRFLVPSDISSQRYSAVIESKMAEKFFKDINPLGKRITFDVDGQTLSYVVVGVFEKPKSFMSMSGGKETFNLYAPYTNLEQITGETTYGAIEMNVKSGENVKETVKSVVNLVERRHDIVGKKKYMISTSEGMMKMVNNITGKMTAFVSAIAAISLLVGGIGIMNIMMVSVTERTREIGIRKAIGANKKVVLVQFLVESVIVSGMGGLIGITLGSGLAYTIGKFIKITPSITLSVIAMAFAFSSAIGIFFGLYPANKAANLNIIDALRYE